MSRRHGKKNKIWQSYSMVLQFGINMIVPILLCTGLGVYIGNKFHISWITIIFFLVGALAGFTSIFRMAKNIYTDHGEDMEEKTKRLGRPKQAQGLELYEDGKTIDISHSKREEEQ